MGPKELALALANCETEDGVVQILKKAGLWDNPARWRDFGDNENNWATIGNQQSDADNALVEKVVNSVDALLMKECLVRGINPTSDQAPQTITDALEEFFDIPGGNIANLESDKRGKLAKDNIILTATGERNYLNLTLIDKGEGQTPQRMPDTILSINKSNKLKVPFVQGKFNMGGTGVLSFCGSGDQSNNFQLIISKRCPHIKEYDETHDLWGFTIIRREAPLSGTGMKSSKYTYLVDEDKNIMSFTADSLAIIPTYKAENRNMVYGMYCKLYDYQLSPRLKTAITMNLYFRLSTLLPGIALPVYMEECREAITGDSMHTTLAGLNVRLNNEFAKKRSNVEERIPFTLKLNGQELSASAWVFKTTTKSGNRLDMKQFRQNEGILLIQNGQTQGNYDKRFFNRSSIGLGYLADYLLLTVDCSRLDRATCENLFMNSRDRTRQSMFAGKLEAKLEEFLKNNETLKEIQTRRREEAIREKISNDKPLEDALANAFQNDPVLSKLFLRGERILQKPVNLGSGEKTDKFKGKSSPTYFLLLRAKSDGSVPYQRNAQLGRTCRIRFKTDACDDFFSRDKNPGIFSLTRNGEQCNEDVILNLKNGIAVLSLDLPDDAKEGDNYSYVATVTDTKNNNSFQEKFVLNVVENQDMDNGRSGTRTPPVRRKKGGTTITSAGISFPHIEELTCDDSRWEEFGFTDETAVVAIPHDENYDFFINADNKYLKTELKSVAKDKSRMEVLKTRFLYSEIMVSFAILNYRKSHADDENDESIIESWEEAIRMITSMISPVILPIIESLGENLNNFTS